VEITGAGLIWMLTILASVSLKGSVARMVARNRPDAVGVPDRNAVVGSIVTPVGCPVDDQV
jgi:hypothetical protein